MEIELDAQSCWKIMQRSETKPSCRGRRLPLSIKQRDEDVEKLLSAECGTLHITSQINAM